MALETPTFTAAAVVASHRLAAEAGRDVLIDGGNAIEASVAMAAMLAVLEPQSGGIGGDGIWLIAEPGRGGGVGAVRAIMAAGPAAQSATVRWFRTKDHQTIPTHGPEAMLTVPGAVDGWRQALDLSRALGGTVPLRRLLEPAIRLAFDGIEVSRSDLDSLEEVPAGLGAQPGFASRFLQDGKSPPEGSLCRTPVMKGMLEQLAHAGLRDFYEGDVAREIGTDLVRLGSPLLRDDLRRFEARWKQPLSVDLRGSTVYGAPLPGGGFSLLALLGMMEQGGGGRPDSVGHLHALIEAGKRAKAIENSIEADPAATAETAAGLLTARALERQAALIATGSCATLPLPLAEDEGTWIGAIDPSGLAVSLTQSMGSLYGSGCVLPRTALLMNNRGTRLSLDERSPDALRPGRIPRLPCNPTLVAFRDGRVLSYGASGRVAQTLVDAQVVSRYRSGDTLVAAIDGPRVVAWRDATSAEDMLRFESRSDPSAVRALVRIGHSATVESAGKLSGFSHVGGVVRHVGGRVEAVFDPRSDKGLASGL